MSAPTTPTRVPGSARAAELGAVSGYVLKLIRGSLSLTQSGLAETLGVDVSTIQGWETGRRPLGALRTSDLVRLRNRLSLMGAQPSAVALISDAVEADTILSSAVVAGDQRVAPELNPLATALHRRRLVNLLTWPFTGITPAALRTLPTLPSRGPVSDRPAIDAVSRDRFFDQMLVTADGTGAEGMAVMRRQASYLLGFDRRSSSRDWLGAHHRKAMLSRVGEHDIPSGIAARSAALALSRHGDPEPVRYFIDNTLQSHEQDQANLTYWAYWLGEIPDALSGDSLLVDTPLESWSGTTVLAHLAEHLTAPGHADINIHSLWTLVLTRPHILDQYPALRRRVAASVERAMSNGVTGVARTELSNLACAVQLADRR